MKKYLFCIIAHILIISMILISCKEPEGNNAGPDIVILDISKETNWDYMVIGKDMSSFYYNVDEETGFPTLLYLKPEVDSEVGFTFLFKDNGLLDKVIHDGHVIYFANYDGYNVDIAVINPNGTIEKFIKDPRSESDINWDAYKKASIQGNYINGRAVNIDHVKTGLDYAGAAIGLGTCIAAFAFPPLVLGCVASGASAIGGLVADYALDDYSGDLLNTFINAVGCAGGGIGAIPDCALLAIDAVEFLSNLDKKAEDEIQYDEDAFNDFYDGGGNRTPLENEGGVVSIYGTPRVWDTLIANTDSLGGNGTIRYQWKCNGAYVGTNKASYIVQPEDKGKTITVTVTRSAHTGSITSAPTSAVDEPALVGTVTISGTAHVGQTLIAKPALDGRGVISYHWKRNTAYGKINIEEKSNSYILKDADASWKITVEVTRSGYSGSVESDPTATVTGGNSSVGIDASLNGEWFSGTGETLQEHKYNDGFYEWKVTEILSQKGTYTTSNYIITFKTTHYHGDYLNLIFNGIPFESKWYSENDLEGLGLSDNYLNALFNTTIKYAYAATASTLTLAFNNVQTVYKKKDDGSGGNINMVMVSINSGEYMRGSNPNENITRYVGSETKQQVLLSSGFFIGKYEVTQEQFEAVMGRNPSGFTGSNLPVECVSWFDAVEFCNKLSELNGRVSVYTITDIERYPSGSITAATVKANWSANGYRLPTEAEWEYACRAGTTTAFNWDSYYINNTQANYKTDYNYSSHEPNHNTTDIASLGKTTAVGSYAANAWGLHDMHGNVWEWCWDWTLEYPRGPIANPKADNGHNDYHIIRGGAYNHPAENLRSGGRCFDYPYRRSTSIGFRVVIGGGSYGGGPYNIGDTGPGGGKVYYDKGFTSDDGWRYLEGIHVPGSYTWASSGNTSRNISGTSGYLGTGKANTAIILAADPNAPAANACANYRGGGKDDWFLPSFYEMEELCKQRHLYGYSQGEAWTSTQYTIWQVYCAQFSIVSFYYNTKGSSSNVIAVRAF